MNHITSWLTLKSVPGIGNLLCARLVRRFGSPGKVLSAAAEALLQVEGMTPRLAGAIRYHRTPDQVLREIDLAQQKGYTIITPQDSLYPALLHHIPDPPPVLFCYGRPEQAMYPVAVVGSRRATHYGLNSTRRLCAQLAERGVTVVSGMALGIDTAAHQGALNGGGRTVAVLGSGLDQIYPPQNVKLFHQIAERGCVMTEFFSQAAPEAHHFPMRNRVISGMSLGTVVVEAARRSGSLITARLAAEQNREVFAVPGSIHSATARGTHDLIKQGAKLVENADDILEEIAPALSTAPSESRGAKPLPELSALEKSVFTALDAHPVHIDELARRVKEDIGVLAGILSQLELKGVICREAGKRFARHVDFLD
ncbi:MAG: DNA-protecting protein DprA [Desulfobacteraceae bacterium]|nr:MAG: DNA-protecting protein DprA [Desulfobacteraceae bacterium]